MNLFKIVFADHDSGEVIPEWEARFLSVRSDGVVLESLRLSGRVVVMGLDGKPLPSIMRQDLKALIVKTSEVDEIVGEVR